MVLDSVPVGIWRACDEARAGIRSWDGESSAVFYSAHSGDTHLIDALAVELHELLSARPMSEPQILAALADVVEPGCEAEAASELHEHLLRLKGFGLLRESLD